MLFFDEENLPIPVPAPTRGTSPPWAGPPPNVLPAPFGALLLQARSDLNQWIGWEEAGGRAEGRCAGTSWAR